MIYLFKMDYPTTFDWLKNELIIADENNPAQFQVLIRDNRVFTTVAALRTSGHVFAIYKSDDEYCAHSFNSEDGGWLETDTPMYGYFDINLTWNELLQQISNKYDSIRKSIQK